jgi:hypothetical protein
MIFYLFLRQNNPYKQITMFKNVPEKYIRASHLIFAVALLRLANVAILEIIPHKVTSPNEIMILGAIVILGFIIRIGNKWLRFLVIPPIIYSFIGVPNVVVDTFHKNPLAGIIMGVYLVIPIFVLEALFNTSKTSVMSRRGRYVAE